MVFKLMSSLPFPFPFTNRNLSMHGVVVAAAVGTFVFKPQIKLSINSVYFFCFLSYSSVRQTTFFVLDSDSNLDSDFFSLSKLFFVLWFWTIVLSREIKLDFCLYFRQFGKLHAQCRIRSYRKHIRSVIDDLPIPSTYCYALVTLVGVFFFSLLFSVFLSFWFAVFGSCIDSFILIYIHWRSVYWLSQVWAEQEQPNDVNKENCKENEKRINEWTNEWIREKEQHKPQQICNYNIQLIYQQ